MDKTIIIAVVAVVVTVALLVLIVGLTFIAVRYGRRQGNLKVSEKSSFGIKYSPADDIVEKIQPECTSPDSFEN